MSPEVVVLSGGRGGATILAELAQHHSSFRLTVVVNGYDDGLSTGLVRRAVPTMLGPSDFRKVCHTLGTSREVIETLAFRAPYRHLREVMEGQWRAVAAIDDYLQRSHEDVGQDMVVGNVVFTDLYLRALGTSATPRQAFHSALFNYRHLCGCLRPLIVPASADPAVLVAVDRDGGVLGSEAAITCAALPLVSVKLIPTPEVDPAADEAVRRATIVVYAPGTFHSSLLPTLYLLRRALAATSAILVWVPNLTMDYGMQGWDDRKYRHEVEAVSGRPVHYTYRVQARGQLVHEGPAFYEFLRRFLR